MASYKVLVPLDGSAFSQQILPYLHKFLPPAGACVILFRVALPPQGIGGVAPVIAPHESELPIQKVEHPFWVKEAPAYPPEEYPMFASQEWERLQAELEDELVADVKKLKKAGYTVSVVARFGDPAEEILAFIRDEEVDLVAMTTHGRSGLSRLLYGSVASEVLRKAPIPVLLLRPIDDPSALEPESQRLVQR
ncbi:MAG: universal stress protein [Chloroflexi bacterium]|nr:universal stress protein [Chloroflexota bacterium]